MILRWFNQTAGLWPPRQGRASVDTQAGIMAVVSEEVNRWQTKIPKLHSDPRMAAAVAGKAAVNPPPSRRYRAHGSHHYLRQRLGLRQPAGAFGVRRTRTNP